MHDLEASAGESAGSQTPPRSKEAVKELRAQAARFNNWMVGTAFFGAFAVGIVLAGIGLSRKDENGKRDDCKGAKYGYAAVLSFGCIMYTLTLIGLLLPYFGLPSWLTCGHRVGGYMPMRSEELNEAYGSDMPHVVRFCDMLKGMGDCLRQGKNLGAVAVASLLILAGVALFLLPGILGFFLPQATRSSLPATCYVPRIGWW